VQLISNYQPVVTGAMCDSPFRACLGISGPTGNEGCWGGGISIISQNFPKSPSIPSIHLNPPSPKQALSPLLERGLKGVPLVYKD
jgi:hypothetical protein